MVVGVLLVVAAIGVALVPETVTVATPHRRYRPQRVRIPATARTRYFAAATLAFAGFAVLGLCTSLTPSFVAGQLHDTSHLVGGAVVFATFASAAVLQIGVRWVSPRTAILIGTVGFSAVVVTFTIISAAMFLHSASPEPASP